MPRHRPLDGRNEAMVERFAAGETYGALAWDYGLSRSRLRQIVHQYSYRTNRVAHQRVSQQGYYIPVARLRSHIQALLRQEEGVMASPITIQAELRLPAPFLQAGDMADVERQLQAYGLMPVQARDRKWRMDEAAPGGYVFAFTFVLPEEP